MSEKIVSSASVEPVSGGDGAAGEREVSMDQEVINGMLILAAVAVLIEVNKLTRGRRK